jgi:membrane carboxypeptidase/penicillin-binding protein
MVAWVLATSRRSTKSSSLTAVADLPVESFPVPDSIEFYPIDPDNGQLTTEHDDAVLFEAFAPGAGPNPRPGNEILQRLFDFLQRNRDE